MKAKAGRASYVNVAQLTQKDPGAEAVAIWMEAILNKLNMTIVNYDINCNISSIMQTQESDV